MKTTSTSPATMQTATLYRPFVHRAQRLTVAVPYDRRGINDEIAEVLATVLNTSPDNVAIRCNNERFTIYVKMDNGTTETHSTELGLAAYHSLTETAWGKHPAFYGPCVVVERNPQPEPTPAPKAPRKRTVKATSPAVAEDVIAEGVSAVATPTLTTENELVGTTWNSPDGLRTVVRYHEPQEKCPTGAFEISFGTKSVCRFNQAIHPAQLETIKRVDEANYAYRLKLAEAEAAKERAKADEYGRYEGFLETMPAMKAGKIQAALERQGGFNGEVMSRKHFVIQSVEAGATVEETSFGPSLMMPGGGYFTANQITKSAIDFAVHLLSRKQPHQIGQPITHAPTIAALAECCALVAAQVQEQTCTTPAPVKVPACNQALFNKLDAAQQKKIFRGVEAHKKAENCSRRNQNTWLVYKGRDGVLCAEPASVNAIKRALLAIGTKGQFKMYADGRGLLHRWKSGLNWLYQAAAWDTSAKAAQQRLEEKAKEANAEQPATFAPVAEVAPATISPVSTKRSPFSKLTNAGDRVQLLHQVGRCAVARLTPKDSTEFTYVCRFRNFWAYAKYREDIPLALADLRRQDRAEVERNAEALTYADFLRDLPEYAPAAIYEFFQRHGLSANDRAPRDFIRRRINEVKLPERGKYLAWLNRVSPTNPA